MAEGTYEYECMRAELLGIEKPEKEEFDRTQAESLKAEIEEIEAEQANILENQDESMNNTGGKLDELNSILSATQNKLNRLKQSACGSLTNIFSRQSVDETNKDAKVGTSSDDNKQSVTSDINKAIENLDEMGDVEKQNNIQITRNASLDIKKKMTSHLDKLDALINKTDNATLAMAAQTQQMKKIAK